MLKFVNLKVNISPDHYNFEAIVTPAALTLLFQGELKICLCGGSISGLHYLIYGVAILCVDT